VRADRARALDVSLRTVTAWDGGKAREERCCGDVLRCSLGVGRAHEGSGEAVFTLMDASTLNRTSTLTIDTFDVTTGQPVDWWEGSSYPVVRADKVTNEERWRKGWNPFPR
jgi:hypothetical protein